MSLIKDSLIAMNEREQGLKQAAPFKQTFNNEKKYIIPSLNKHHLETIFIHRRVVAAWVGEGCSYNQFEDDIDVSTIFLAL